jgi:hypothetical protein
LIRRTGVNNPLWNAPHVHGDLLNLGFEVAQSSVAKHMTKPPASCPCKTLIGPGVIPRIG